MTSLRVSGIDENSTPAEIVSSVGSMTKAPSSLKADSSTLLAGVNEQPASPITPRAVAQRNPLRVKSVPIIGSTFRTR